MRYTKDIQPKKCITAKSHAFRQLKGNCINPCSCKIIQKNNFVIKQQNLKYLCYNSIYFKYYFETGGSLWKSL